MPDNNWFKLKTSLANYRYRYMKYCKYIHFRLKFFAQTYIWLFQNPLQLFRFTLFFFFCNPWWAEVTISKGYVHKFLNNIVNFESCSLKQHGSYIETLLFSLFFLTVRRILNRTGGLKYHIYFLEKKILFFCPIFFFKR